MKRIPTRQWLAENQRITALCSKLARLFPGDRPEDVRDALQDTFEAFYERKREVDDWESYLSKIFFRTIGRAFARRRHRANLYALSEDLNQLADELSADPAFRLQEEQFGKLLDAAIADLTPRLRATFDLHLLDLSVEEIAQRLGIGVEAVRKNLNRGRAALRASIESSEDDHEDE